MWVPRDNNLSVKEYNKTSKYKDLEIEREKKNEATYQYHFDSNSGSPGYNQEWNRWIYWQDTWQSRPVLNTKNYTLQSSPFL